MYFSGFRKTFSHISCILSNIFTSVRIWNEIHKIHLFWGIFYKYLFPFSCEFLDSIFSLSCIAFVFEGFSINEPHGESSVCIFCSLSTVMCLDSFFEMVRPASIERLIRTFHDVGRVGHSVKRKHRATSTEKGEFIPMLSLYLGFFRIFSEDGSVRRGQNWWSWGGTMRWSSLSQPCATYSSEQDRSRSA